MSRRGKVSVKRRILCFSFPILGGSSGAGGFVKGEFGLVQVVGVTGEMVRRKKEVFGKERLRGSRIRNTTTN